MVEQNQGKRDAEFNRLRKEATSLLAKLQKVIAGEDLNLKVDVKHNEPFTVRPTSRDAKPTKTGPADNIAGREELNGPERRIIDAIAWWESIGINQPEDTGVAFMARYSPTSTGYTNPRGTLNQKGLIQYSGNNRMLTDRGREMAQYPENPGTGEELRQQVLDKLPGPERRILSVLIEKYPASVSNPDAAQGANYSETSTGYTNPRGRLRKFGLIEYTEEGLRARDILFPEENK